MSLTAPSAGPTTTSLTVPLAIALATSVVVVSGVSLIYPVLPIISGDLSISEAEIGIVIAAFTLPAVVLAPVFGLIADFHGRRWLLSAGLLLFAIAGVGAATSGDFTTLILWRIVQGIAMSALSPLTIVLLSDLCGARDQELAAQGWKVAIDRIAMIVFPILGGLLAAVSWRSAFLPFLFTLPVAVAAILYMPETRPREPTTLRLYFTSIAQALQEPKIVLAFAVGFFRFFLDYGFFIYLPLFLTLRHGTTPIVSAIMLAISAAGAIITAITVRRLSAVMTIERLLALAFLITGLGLATITVQSPLWLIATGTFAIGLGNGLISPLQKSMITRASPPALRGGVISCDRVIQQIAKSLAPTCLGLLLLVAPIEAVFYGLVAMSLMATVTMLAGTNKT